MHLSTDFGLVFHTGREQAEPVDKSVGKRWKECAKRHWTWPRATVENFKTGCCNTGFTWQAPEVKLKNLFSASAALVNRDLHAKQLPTECVCLAVDKVGKTFCKPCQR